MQMSKIRSHLLEPLYGWVTHSAKLPYWKALEQTQYWPTAILRELQWRRLKRILRFVYENNEFYRRRFHEAGITPDDIRCIDDIQMLPLLTKREVRGDTPTMISKGYDIQSLQKAKTGGSTGKALDLYFTETCSSLRNACTLRHDLWTGWKRGEPIAAIWGNPVSPGSFRESIRRTMVLPETLCLDTMEISTASVKRFVDKWRKLNPTLIFGHAHSIYVLARSLRELGIDCLRPAGILSTSMMLIPTERKLIEEVFGARVTDRYGCEEVGLIASECEQHNGMHLNIEHLVIEFIDDDENRPVLLGRAGKIVVTDLLNTAMPLIRYVVEDVGVPAATMCACGRGLPLMERLTGRVADFLLKANGAKVAGISLIENTLTRFPGIDQMQIVQDTIDHFDLRLVRGEGFDDSVLQALREYLQQVFGAHIKVRFSMVDEIAAEKSGKYRFSICRIGPENV